MYRFSYNNDSEEILLIKPDGSAHFLGVWETVKLMFALCLRRRTFSINDEVIESTLNK